MEVLEAIRDFGVTAVVLAWFMFRADKRIDRVERTLAELVKAVESSK